jgi:hypothetical protein
MKKLCSVHDAKAAGATRYYTGVPCKHGHVSERMVSNRRCVTCLEQGRDAWRAANPGKCAVARAAWTASNPERFAKAHARYVASDKGRMAQAARARKWFLLNREKADAASAKWASENQDMRAASAGRRRATKLNSTPAWADHALISDIYKLAGIYRKFGHDVHVDHIVPLQSSMVCGLHVQDNLQIIPATENLSKGNRFQNF